MTMRGWMRGASASLVVALAGCAAPQDAGVTMEPGPLSSVADAIGGMTQGLQLPWGGGGASGSGAGGIAVAGAPAAATPGAVRDPFAGQGVAAAAVPPAGSVSAAPAAATGATKPAAAAPKAAGGSAATRHTVVAGETAWSIARKYGVGIADLAAANNLGEGMSVRTGQTLTIPATGARVAEAVTAPGAGSPTPQPPSASKPLPDEKTVPKSTPVAKPEAPDLGATRTAASGSGKFRMPANGSIVRAYSKGKNDGIDISAGAGSAVKAAGSGTVAAITRDTDGVPIVVVRHEGTLMTVYAGIDGLSVGKGDKVKSGQTIGKAGKSGVVHFEVRQGFESVDPEKYL